MNVTEARTVEPLDPSAVQRAEQEAAEAAALVEALEARVVEGDEDVTPDQIANARELGHFAQLRSEATRRKAERARKAERMRALGDLADDMRAAQRTDEQIIAALDTFENAMRRLGEAVGDHHARIADWRRRMQALGVPSHNGDRAHGAAEDAGLTWSTNSSASVNAADLTYARLPLGSLITVTVHRVADDWRRSDQASGDQRYAARSQSKDLHELIPDWVAVAGPVDLREQIRKSA